MNNRELNASVLIPNLVILVLVATGILSDQSPLDSKRPPAAATERMGAPARLWEDPLKVGLTKASSDSAAASDSKSAPAVAPATGLDVDQAEPGEPILILPVLLDGSPHAEDGETRLRTRYAVLSALSRAQYLPSNPDRLQSLAPIKALYERSIPYEVFTPRPLVTDGVIISAERLNALPLRPPPESPLKLHISGAYKRVVVLWLDEVQLLRSSSGTQEPSALLRRLDDVLMEILPLRWQQQLEIKIIGPTTSAGLVGLVQHKGPLWHKAQILSPRATAAPEAIQLSAFATLDQRVQTLFTDSPWKVERLVASDDKLADMLLAELERRGAKPGPESHVVLVGEWDSFYSRALSRTMAAKINDRYLSIPYQTRAAWAWNPSFFHEFSYLKGLDGLKPRPGQEDPSRKTGTTTTSAERRPDSVRASGESQLDYLRRLQERMLVLQAELQRGRDGKRGEITAIGVVGSDTYDKLIVMRALRESFPRATFFTTDLDASYLDREEREWTKNLLVVAPFGLRAGDHFQGRTLPFRDSYQTALYLACLFALNVEETHHGMLENVILAPRVFEIGRSEIFDLSAPPVAIHPAVHPPRHRDFIGRWNTPWGLFACLAIGVVLLIWLRSLHSPLHYRDNHGDAFIVHDSFSRYFLCLLLGLGWFTAVAGIVGGIVAIKAPVAELLDASFARRDLASVFAGFEKNYGLSVRFAVPIALAVPLLLLVHIMIFPYCLRRLAGLVPPSRRARWTLKLSLGAFICIGCWSLVEVIAAARHWSEEPYAFFEGVSIWPTNILRALLIIFSIHFVLRIQFQLVQLKNQIALTHGLTPPEKVPAMVSDMPQSPWPLLNAWRPFLWFPSRFTREPQRLPQPAPSTTCYPGREDTLWQDFCRITTLRGRFVRIVCYGTVYLGIFLLLGAVLGFPFSPVRGLWSNALDKGVLCAAIFAYVYLLFYVFDATLVTAEFCRRITRFIGETSRLQESHTVHLVDDLVGVVSKLIYLPFSVLFMFIASRNALFDRWDWPVMLLGVFGSGLLLIIVASVKLQRAAGDAKRAAIQDIDAKLGLICTTAARAAYPSARSLDGPTDRGATSSDDFLSVFLETELAALRKQTARWWAGLLGVIAAAQAPRKAKPPGPTSASTTVQPGSSRASAADKKIPVSGEQTPKLTLETVQLESLEDTKKLSEISTEAFRRREAELREQRRQIEAFDDVAFQHWHQNPIFRAILIPLGGFGSLQILEKVVSTLPH